MTELLTQDTPMHNPNCDGGHCAVSEGKVAVLPLPGNANLHLCHECWTQEMCWRGSRNHNLATDAQYPILLFSEAKEYRT